MNLGGNDAMKTTLFALAVLALSSTANAAIADEPANLDTAITQHLDGDKSIAKAACYYRYWWYRYGSYYRYWYRWACY